MCVSWKVSYKHPLAKNTKSKRMDLHSYKSQFLCVYPMTYLGKIKKLKIKEESVLIIQLSLNKHQRKINISSSSIDQQSVRPIHPHLSWQSFISKWCKIREEEDGDWE